MMQVDHPVPNSASKTNVTIAKEPNLVTALRAHRQNKYINYFSSYIEHHGFVTF